MTYSHEKVSDQLGMQKNDYVTSAAKAALGCVPFAGSLLAELAGTVIPNQRIDRIVNFASALEARISKIEQDFVREQLHNESFTDLLEEGLRQAARSITDERREYIASLIANSLESGDVEYYESKHLLKLLDEINDIEIIWLRFYLVPTMDGDTEFREKHKEILKPVSKVMGSPQPVRDKGTLQDNYKHHLERLGLLEKDNKSFRLASLGSLLLRVIGLTE